MAAFGHPPLPPALPLVLFRFFYPSYPYHQNPGRGGGIRTPIPGFGDRSPNRWTTPLKPKPHCRSPWSGQYPAQALLSFFMRRVLAARTAEFLGFHAFGMLLLIFCGGVIAIFALTTLQSNDFPHCLESFSRECAPECRAASENPNYSMISVTAPAPTVWPPSRMAKRRPFSSATGVISATSQLTLSPGITISTPVGSFTSPVTSVVRK